MQTPLHYHEAFMRRMFELLKEDPNLSALKIAQRLNEEELFPRRLLDSAINSVWQRPEFGGKAGFLAKLHERKEKGLPFASTPPEPKEDLLTKKELQIVADALKKSWRHAVDRVNEQRDPEKQVNLKQVAEFLKKKRDGKPLCDFIIEYRTSAKK